MRGTTRWLLRDSPCLNISTHVPHAGHDGGNRQPLHNDRDFNSRAPCGARRPCPRSLPRSSPFQLTCPMRGTTRWLLRDSPCLNISTHVPHAGHDGGNRQPLHNDRDFNSRAPCGARRPCPRSLPRSSPFQLTCPMRGTTNPRMIDFSFLIISTHVPHAGHDIIRIDMLYLLGYFNSRAPCGARLG